MKVIKIDMKKYNLSDDLVQNRSKQRNKIRVVNPTWLEQGFDDDNDACEGVGLIIVESPALGNKQVLMDGAHLRIFHTHI